MKKNFKRLSALTLSLCLVVMTLAVTPVSAAKSSAIDDFDGDNQGKVNGTGETYYTSSATSGLFVKPTSITGQHLTVDSTKGYNGSSALYVHCDAKKYSDGKYYGSTLSTRDVQMTDKTVAILRYKLRFENLFKTGTNAPMCMSGITDGVDYKTLKTKTNSGAYLNAKTDTFKMTAYGSKDIENLTIAANVWYDVVTMVEGTGANKSISVYVLDDSGEVVLKTKNPVPKVTGDTIRIWPFYINPHSESDPTRPLRFVVDNAKLMEYTTDTAPDLDSFGSNIADDAKNVALDKSFNLAFDQEITEPVYGESGTVKLYKTSDENKTPVDVEIKNITFNSFTIDPKSNLESNTEYTIDFSELANTAGTKASKTIKFKTLDASSDPVTFMSAAYGANRKHLTSESKLELTDDIYLTFDIEVAQPSEGSVTISNDDGSVPVSLNVEADGKTVKVSHENVFKLNTSYTIDFSGITSKAGGALIGVTTSLGFSTVENREALLLMEDFENINPGEEGVPLSGYTKIEVISNEYTKESPVIRKGVGVNGSNGIQITKTSNNQFQPRTVPFTFEDNETVFVECKFKINSIDDNSSTDAAGTCSKELHIGTYNRTSPTSTNSILKINRRKFDKFNFCEGGGSAKERMSFGKWYTVVYKITRDKTTGYLFDEHGRFVCEDTLKYTVGADGAPVTLYIFSEYPTSRLDMCIDDLRMYRLGTNKLNMVGEYSSVESGYLKPSKHFTLTFNQPMDKLTAAYNSDSIDKVKLYKGSTQIDTKVSYIAANELRLTPSEELIDGVTYTLKFENSLLPLSGNGSALSDINFTIKPTYDVIAKSCALSSVPSDANLAAGTDISLSLTNSGDAKSGVVVAALYSNDRLKKLIGLEIFENKSIAAGDSTLTLKLSESYNGVGHIEFMLYDSLAKFNPLMHSYKVK